MEILEALVVVAQLVELSEVEAPPAVHPLADLLCMAIVELPVALVVVAAAEQGQRQVEEMVATDEPFGA